MHGRFDAAFTQGNPFLCVCHAKIVDVPTFEKSGDFKNPMPIGICFDDAHEPDAATYLFANALKITGQRLKIDFRHRGTSRLEHSASFDQWEDSWCVRSMNVGKVGLNIPFHDLNVNATDSCASPAPPHQLYKKTHQDT
jgi:hypothetical protein